MPQVSLYLDDDTKARLEEAAKEAGVSQSRWLAELIRAKTSSEWPALVRELAGAWPDLAGAEDTRSDEPDDVRREPL